MKAKTELTEAAVRKVIEEKKPTSMTKLAHELGYKGSVSSTLTKKFRALIPDIDAILKGSSAAVEGAAGEAEGAKSKKEPKSKAAKSKAKPAVKSRGKWPRDPRNVFRPGAYASCFDILAAHKEGLPKAKLVELLAKETGKDAKHAAYDAQVLLSAGGNEPGLSRNDGPRHRSCRAGFWVKKSNGHVQLMVD